MATGILKFVRQWHLQKKSLISSRRSRHKGKMGRGGILCLRRRPHRRSTSRCSSSRRRRSSPLRGGAIHTGMLPPLPHPLSRVSTPAINLPSPGKARGREPQRARARGRVVMGAGAISVAVGKEMLIGVTPMPIEPSGSTQGPPRLSSSRGRGRGSSSSVRRLQFRIPTPKGLLPSRTPLHHIRAANASVEGRGQLAGTEPFRQKKV